jgi:hypothetical protein
MNKQDRHGAYARYARYAGCARRLEDTGADHLFSYLKKLTPERAFLSPDVPRVPCVPDVPVNAVASRTVLVIG